jgi:hypothetical protein
LSNLAIPFTAPHTEFNLVLVVDTPVNLRHLLHEVLTVEKNDAGTYSGRFIPHGTFSNWIAGYVTDLENGRYRTTEHGEISRFPEYGRGTATGYSLGIRAHLRFSQTA